MASKRRPSPSLRITTPAHNTSIVLALPSSALSSATDDSDDSDPKPRPLRNMKKLSLALPAPPLVQRHRRPSVMSLPAPATPLPSSVPYRKVEDGDDSAPYPDGPIQVIPGIWIGSEDHARDWKGLIERSIKSILNVAKEVASPLEPLHSAQPLRAVSSTPDFKHPRIPHDTYHSPNLSTGRPAMHYLKLQWSHGQQDLVNIGFQTAMAFTDAALRRGDGVLVHCQCGISRSATLVIALVMRAAAERSPSVPPEIWDFKGMQDAYSFVKQKSKWVSPNMSLIYQLLEYEKKLKGDSGSSSDSEKSSVVDEEEEWGRRRRMLDESPLDPEDEHESTLVMREAEALDRAMEDRIVARQSSASSLASTSTSGVGMGAAWRNRYGSTRKRAGSVASNLTSGSILSEDLVEEEEEDVLLRVRPKLDDPRLFAEIECSSTDNMPDDEIKAIPQRAHSFTPTTARPSFRPPPSAPTWKTTSPPPATALRSALNFPATPNRAVRSAFPPCPASQAKRRPVPIGILPPVPSSPVAIIIESSSPPTSPTKSPVTLSSPPHRTCSLSLPPVRIRTESKKLLPPPLHLLKKTKQPQLPEQSVSSFVSTPSQTLFVFPPSPTMTTRTPSTMTLTSNISGPIPFPSLATPRVSTFRSHGRVRSFIGLGASSTPTIAFSKVDARGYIGLE